MESFKLKARVYLCHKWKILNYFQPSLFTVKQNYLQIYLFEMFNVHIYIWLTHQLWRGHVVGHFIGELRGSH